MPSRKPPAAGNTLSLAILIDGISSDHTLAATITPLAKPNSVFCSRSGISFLMKKTNADPARPSLSSTSRRRRSDYSTTRRIRCTKRASRGLESTFR